MKRVIIIGCGGAGKSTLARKMGELTGIPVIHLDQLFWKPGWVERTREEFDPMIQRELEKEAWIMDGNFSRTLPQRIQRCDMVIYLDFSRMSCLLGVLKRVLTTYGKVRPDMGEGCPERMDFGFMKWVWNYNQNKRENNYRLLNEATHAETVVLKNRRSVRRFLKSLENEGSVV